MHCSFSTHHTGAASGSVRCTGLHCLTTGGTYLRAAPGTGAHLCGPSLAADRRQHHPSTLLTRSAADQQSEAAVAVSTDEEEWVEVGRIGPPHGVRGEMKVQPLTDFPEDRLGTPGPRCDSKAEHSACIPGLASSCISKIQDKVLKQVLGTCAVTAGGCSRRHPRLGGGRPRRPPRWSWSGAAA
jgi:hypothetical protein